MKSHTCSILRSALVKVASHASQGLAIVALVLSLWFGAVPGRAQSVSTYFITDVDPSKFPTIQLRVRVLGQDNQAVSGLTSANLPIFENGKPVPAQNVQVTPHDDAPLTVVFVVDQGAQSNYGPVLATLKQAISQLVDGGFLVDGRDTVKLLVRENPGSGDRTTARLGPTTRGRELVDFVANYPFPHSAGRTKGLEGVGDAISDMDQLVPDPATKDAAIIFIARAIEDPQASVAVASAQNHAADAKSKFITIYSMQAGTGDAQPLQVLAQGANGRFVKLLPNAVGAVTDIYQSLAAQRQYYTISYTSPSAASGVRQITIGAPSKPDHGRIGEYQANVAPPMVTLTPQSKLLRRAPIPGVAAGENPYSPLSVRAQVNVAWTDGITRAIQSIELSVNGVKKDSKTGAQLPPGATSIEMVADLSDITSPGNNVAALSAHVVDSLGNEATAEERVTVEVVPAPTPTPPPPSLSRDSVIVLIVLGILALIIIILLVILLVRRRPAGVATTGASGRGKARSGADIASTDQPLATIFVLQGPSALVNQPIPVTRTRLVLGRDPKSSDVTFYPGEPSSVSRVHAVLEYDEARGFSLTDKTSANGTRVNGRKLSGETPQTMRDGDEVVLGDLAKRGVRLRFALGKGARWSGGNEDKTQIGI